LKKDRLLPAPEESSTRTDNPKTPGNGNGNSDQSTA